MNRDEWRSLLNDDEFILELKNKLNSVTSIFGDPAKVQVHESCQMVNTLFNTSSGKITVDANTFTGHNVCILTGAHRTDLIDEARMNTPMGNRDIHIGKGVWLASNSTICGPCTIGDHAVIAAGAVVVPGTYVPPYTIWGGCPAHELRTLNSNSLENDNLTNKQQEDNMTYKEFKRKVQTRLFAIENSGRGINDNTIPIQDGSADNQLYSHINQEFLQAASCQVFGMDMPIFSNRKVLGKAIVFCKRAIRKLIKVCLGWYIIPIYQRQSHYNGKLLNVISMQQEMIQSMEHRLQECMQKTEAQEMIHNTELRLQEYMQETETKLEKLSQLCDTFLPTNDDDFYHAFEEKFRGSREDIKHRLQVYVPIIKNYLADWSNGRFVDIGSGRGEWLDILKENGAKDCVGVDLNQRQNAICESFGHKTICMDAIEYLMQQPDASLVMVSGIQIIEHLPMSVLMELFKQCYRVLKPGGVILFETPNPKNLIVAADTFYIDFSHQKPLDPRGIEFLAEYCGFGVVKTIDANAHELWQGIPLTEADPDYELKRQFNDVKWHLYGPRDYALFAVKE